MKNTSGFLPAAIFRLWVLVYLSFCSADDIRQRSIKPLWAILTALLSAAAGLATHTYPLSEYIKVLGFSAILFAISFASHGAIGYGDCFVILACGFLTGLSEEVLCMMAGLVYCAAWSSAMLLLKKAGRKDTLPFVPYLSAGHATIFLAELISFFR